MTSRRKGSSWQRETASTASAMDTLPLRRGVGWVSDVVWLVSRIASHPLPRRNHTPVVSVQDFKQRFHVLVLQWPQLFLRQDLTSVRVEVQEQLLHLSLVQNVVAIAEFVIAEATPAVAMCGVTMTMR